MTKVSVRPKAALIALLLVAVGLATSPVQQAEAWSFSNQQIADKSRAAAIGSWGGQCKVWAGNVVNAVLAANGISARVGGYTSPGGAYYGAYQNAGGTPIGANDAQPGDLIQTINAAQKNMDYPTTVGLHTAIVVGRTATPGTYVVRDSNFQPAYKELVAEHLWDTAAWARDKGVAVYVWRFGQVGAPVPDVSRFAGRLVKWAGESPTPVTTWLVGPDLTRTWVPDGGTYNWMKAAGAGGPDVVDSATLSRLPDRSGVRATTDQLNVNWAAPRNTNIWSTTNGYLAVFQGDGNFVIYAPGGRAVFASRTTGTGADRLIMQGDGNLVIYAGSRALWATGTGGHGRTRLVMQGDGNLVLYRADGRATWATSTNGGTNQLARQFGYRLL